MSDILWQAEDVLRAVHGSCLHEQGWTARGVSIDSRIVKKGDLYIALPGTAHDGHNHVADAFTNGAAAAIVARHPEQVPPDAPLIFADDTLAALHALGHAGRTRAKGKIVAITGSSGKSATRDMLRMALGAVSHAFASSGVSHTLWGLPLALANLPPEADYGIFDIAIGQSGNLGAQSEMARPHIAVVTSIESLNAEIFGSGEEAALIASEIFQGMKEGGIAILSKDSEHYTLLAAAAKTEGVKKIFSFSRTARADAQLVDCAITVEGCAVNAVISGYKAHYAIGSPGMHLVQNSLPALLTACILSGKIDECVNALSQYKSAQETVLATTIPAPIIQKIAS